MLRARESIFLLLYDNKTLLIRLYLSIFPLTHPTTMSSSLLSSGPVERVVVTDRGQMAALMRRAGERGRRPPPPDPAGPSTDLEARTAVHHGSALPSTPDALLTVLCDEIRKWASCRISHVSLGEDQQSDDERKRGSTQHNTYEHMLVKDRRTSALHHKRVADLMQDVSTQVSALSVMSRDSKTPVKFIGDIRQELITATQALRKLEEDSKRIRARWAIGTEENIDMLRRKATELDKKHRALVAQMSVELEKEEALLWKRVATEQAKSQEDILALTEKGDQHATKVEICIASARELMERIGRASDSSDGNTQNILSSTMTRLSSAGARCSMLRSGMMEDMKEKGGRLNITESTYATLQRISSIIRLIQTMSDVMAIDVSPSAVGELLTARRRREDTQRALMNAEKGLIDAESGRDALQEAYRALQSSGNADIATATKLATMSSQVRHISEDIVAMTESVRSLRVKLAMRDKDVEMAEMPQLMERLSKIHTHMAAQLSPLQTIYRRMKQKYNILQALEQDRTQILQELRRTTSQEIDVVMRRVMTRLQHEAAVACAEIQRIWVSCAEEEDREIGATQATIRDHTSTAKRRTRSIIMEQNDADYDGGGGGGGGGGDDYYRLSDHITGVVGRFVLTIRPFWQERALAAIAVLRGLVVQSLVKLDHTLA